MTRYALALLTCCAVAAQAEIIVGPGAVAGPVNVGVESTTIVGSTTVTSGGSNAATNVTGNVLTLDALLGPAPGTISLQTLNGNGLNANGGTLSASNGVSVLTQNGHAVLANGAASVAVLDNALLQTTGTGAALVAIGGSLSATGVTVSNLGNSTPTVSAGHGAIAESGGQVTLLAGTSIATGAFNAVGLGASGSGSKVMAIAAVPVVMNGRGAMGLYLHDGGQVSLPDASTLQMKASNSVGVAVDNTTITLPRQLTAAFSAAPLAGQAAGTGLVAFNGGSASASDFTVQGVGAGAGAWARPGSTITLSGASNLAINANANPTYYTLQTSYLATASGSVGSIFGVTSGLPIGGLLSNGGTLNSTGSTVTVTSSNGVGAYAGLNSATPSNIVLVDTRIETTGTSSFGIEAAEHGSVVGSNTTVSTSGGGAALFVFPFNYTASIDLTSSNVTATGANTSGIASLNLSAALTGTVSLDATPLHSAANGIDGVGGPVTVTLSSGSSITGDALLLEAAFNASAPQATAIDVATSGASALSGDARADAQSSARIHLASGSTWTGAALSITHVDTDATGLWTVTGDSVLTQDLANAGRVQFTAPGAHKTVTVHDYHGGGTLGVHSFLGADGSPSDRLVIDGGAATGTSLLHVDNTTGPGALTSGDGILVVEAINGGTTVAGAFALDGPVVAGDWIYELVRGGSGGADNWYLRSRAACALPPCDVPRTAIAIPVDAKWMLAFAMLGVAAFGAVALRRRRALR